MDETGFFWKALLKSLQMRNSVKMATNQIFTVLPIGNTAEEKECAIILKMTTLQQFKN